MQDSAVKPGIYNSNRHLVCLCVLEKQKPVINQPVKFHIEGC